jgi:hypothetical protein
MRNLAVVEFATLEWVDWFNNRRLLRPIGNNPPAEAEARYYARPGGMARAARFKPNNLRQTRGGAPVPVVSREGYEWRGFPTPTNVDKSEA